ncbi:MAG: general secretion pathway protein GspB [Dokdonella sp.]
MSLILEALKKSERQRRLGESPSLGSPVMAVRRRRSLLPALVVLIAIGLTALWWMGRERAAPEATANVAPAGQVVAATQPLPAPPAAAVAHPNVAPAAQQKKLAVPVPAMDAQASQREKLRSGELVAANPRAGAAATIKESEPVSAADPAAIAAAMADAKKPSMAPERANPVAKASAAPAPAAALKSPAAEPAAAADPTLKLMWELPLATRRSLPEIKLSMHVFATEPKQRFVIINGERRAEGDEFEGLKLIEIRTDGVIFEHENVRFLYPRGGR